MAETKTYTVMVELKGTVTKQVECDAEDMHDALREAEDEVWTIVNSTPRHELLTDISFFGKGRTRLKGWKFDEEVNNVCDQS